MKRKFTEEEDVTFLETIERDLPKSRAILSELFDDCNRCLEQKDHMGLVKLIEHTKKEGFHTTSQTRYLFLTVQCLSEEMLRESDRFFVDSYSDYLSLIEAYRRITLLLRRLELTGKSESLYEEALAELFSMPLTPNIVRIVLTKELFDSPELIARTFVENLRDAKDSLECLEYSLGFLEEYKNNYWKITCADILLSLSDYRSALSYLEMLDNPGPEEKDLISSLKELINE